MLTEVNQIAIVQLKSLNLPIISEKAIELGMDFSQMYE